MVIVLARAFGGFALDPTNVINVTQLSQTPLVDADFEGKQQGDGALFLQSMIAGREIKLAGGLYGSDADAARLKLDALAAALNNGEQYLTLTTDRRILCRCTAFDYEPVESLPLSGFAWTAKLRSRWATFEKTAVTTDTFTWNASPQFQALAANTGAADTWPRIVLTELGPGFTGAQLILINASTDMQLSLQGVAMNSGQSISIDMREGRINDGLSAEITVLGVEGSFFPFGPGAGPTLELQTNILVPNFSVVVTRNDQFWAP